MKKVGKRALALVLAMALLISCTISGLVLPVAAQSTQNSVGNLFPDGDFESGTVDFGFKIKDGVGFGGSKALVIPAGTSNKALNTITLLDTLKTDKIYVIRYKAKGNKHSVYWVDTANTGFSGSLPGTSQSTVTDAFIQMQYVFSPKKETNKIGGFGLYNTHATDEAYLDDFEIFEYIPGMDMFPDTDGCAALPITSSVKGGLFGQFTSVSVDDFKDGDKYVIKFSGLDAENGTEALLPLTRASYSVNVFDTTDRDIVVSFKYKSENDAGRAFIESAYLENNNMNGKAKTSLPDENGWRTHTARINVKNVNPGGTMQLKFSGASEVLIKDFYFGESVELSLSDLKWTTNATQIKAGTPLSLSVKLTNNSIEDLVAQNEVTVNFIARKGNEELNLGTVVKKDGMRAGESVLLTTPTTWDVPAGDWVVSAHASTTFGEGLERIGTQGHFRAADTFITAPT